MQLMSVLAIVSEILCYCKVKSFNLNFQQALCHLRLLITTACDLYLVSGHRVQGKAWRTFTLINASLYQIAEGLFCFHFLYNVRNCQISAGCLYYLWGIFLGYCLSSFALINSKWESDELVIATLISLGSVFICFCFAGIHFKWKPFPHSSHCIVFISTWALMLDTS